MRFLDECAPARSADPRTTPESVDQSAPVRCHSESSATRRARPQSLPGTRATLRLARLIQTTVAPQLLSVVLYIIVPDIWKGSEG